MIERLGLFLAKLEREEFVVMNVQAGDRTGATG
jgi:hypothetical protein